MALAWETGLSLFSDVPDSITGQKTLHCLLCLWQVRKIQYLNLILLLLLQLAFCHLNIFSANSACRLMLAALAIQTVRKKIVTQQ